MEDFNQPSQQRSNLLERLQERIGSVAPQFWALCQVCDLQALEKLVELACISPSIVRVFASQTFSVVLYWTQSTRGTSCSSTPNTSLMKRDPDSSPADSPLAKRQKTTDSPASSPLAERQTTTNSVASLSPLYRSKVATALAKERDGRRCVLTGAATIEVAHIYPFCRLSGTEENISGLRHVFWDHLKSFWSEEKVAAWEAELFSRGLSEPGNETVANVVTLSKNAHALWNRGAFALKPISISNDTTLKVQFFWQKKQPDTQGTISLCTLPFSTETLDRNEGVFDHMPAKLVEEEGFKPIKSGDIFDLTTDDPIKKPLPSFKLLELQWFLTRIIGMAGAAFPYEAGSGYDSDEDVPGLCLDEGDPSFLSGLPQSSPLELRHEVNRLSVEISKHHTEEAEEDRVGMEGTM